MRRAALLLLLTGCYKPLVTCPEPPPLLWPLLSTKQLTASASEGDVARAFVVDLLTLEGRLAESLELLNGYRAKTPKTQVPK